MHWIWAGIIFVAAVAVYGISVWLRVSHSINASKPLIASAAAYEQHPLSPSLRILIAGDSTGVGVGAKDNRESIAGRIGAAYPSADIANIAHSGDTLADLEKVLRAKASGKYDIVLLQIGANDITGRTTYADIRAALTRVLSRAHQLGNKVVVMTSGDVGLSPAFMWPLSAYFDHRTRETRKIFIEETGAVPGTVYIDLFREPLDEIFITDVPRYYASDRFHPSGDGYAVWYRALKPALP